MALTVCVLQEITAVWWQWPLHHYYRSVLSNLEPYWKSSLSLEYQVRSLLVIDWPCCVCFNIIRARPTRVDGCTIGFTLSVCPSISLTRNNYLHSQWFRSNLMHTSLSLISQYASITFFVFSGFYSKLCMPHLHRYLKTSSVFGLLQPVYSMMADKMAAFNPLPDNKF